MSRDKIYDTDQQRADFSFDDRVVAVFPDMIQRSVPGYRAIIDHLPAIARHYVCADSHCYDLGCSLGASTLAIDAGIQADNCQIIAVDNSSSMIEQCQQLLNKAPTQHPIELVCSDLQDVAIRNASLSVFNFTLQFIPIEQRQTVIDAVYDGTVNGGALVLSEKICFPGSEQQSAMTDIHHTFKSINGYSDLEISQKRSALENVLLPETIESHRQRLLQAGFRQVWVWFQCFNFCSILAVK